MQNWYFRYDIALLYLKQASYNLEMAVEAYLADERWGKEHPIEPNMKGKGKTKYAEPETRIQ